MTYQSPINISTNTTFAELQAGGISAMIERFITVMAAITPTLAPTAAPTLAASGSGGTIPTADYYIACTEYNGIGETTLGPVSASISVTLGQDIVATFPTLQTSNLARNTYISLASTGPFTLAAEGTTASTVTISSLPAGGAGGSFGGVLAPTTNTTALSATKLQNLRSVKQGRIEMVWQNLRQLIDEFVRGEPIAFNSALTKLRDGHIVFSTLSEICYEVGVLIDANPGSFVGTPTGIGSMRNKRTWP